MAETVLTAWGPVELGGGAVAGSWIHFSHSGLSASGKTQVWHVIGRTGGVLGCIAWCGPWRQYAFRPKDRTEFEEDCLRMIADFCERATADHKAGRKADAGI